MADIRKDYPLTGVLKPFTAKRKQLLHRLNQEGLPAYWGIETALGLLGATGLKCKDQEGLPAYWGIETFHSEAEAVITSVKSGRITRLLGY